MSKLVSFGGFKEAAGAFKQSVKPVDVIIGGILARGLGPIVKTQILDRLIPASTPADSFLRKPEVQSLLCGAIIGGAAYVATKGHGRGPGILVGAVGISAIDFGGAKLAEMSVKMLPASTTQGYVSYGLLSRDSAYGMLTQDSAYGASGAKWPASRDTTPRDLAELRAFSETHAEGSAEAEYA